MSIGTRTWMEKGNGPMVIVVDLFVGTAVRITRMCNGYVYVHMCCVEAAISCCCAFCARAIFRKMFSHEQIVNGLLYMYGTNCTMCVHKIQWAQFK